MKEKKLFSFTNTLDPNSCANSIPRDKDIESSCEMIEGRNPQIEIQNQQNLNIQDKVHQNPRSDALGYSSRSDYLFGS
jgi:hypothetical protein